MFNILIPLGAFLSAGMGFLAVRAAMGLGLGVISYAAVGIAITQLMNMAQTSYNSIGYFALQIAGLAGIGQALGIIAGAITFRATYLFMAKIGVIPK